ncbi:MAG: tetratricopeptide repeat protein [Patescibacteria group bacterium]
MSRINSVSFEKFIEPLRKLFSGSVIAIFFLTPLVFAPFTSEALEMNKQIVFVVLTLMAAVGLFGSMVIEKRVSLRGGWMVNVIPLVLLGTLLLSTIFSIAGVESWLGYGGQEYVSFLTVAAGVIFFLTLVNGGTAKLAKQAFVAVLLSTSLVAFVTLLSFLQIYILPFAFTHVAGFNTVGNINAFVSWLTPVALIGLGIYLVDVDGEILPNGPGGLFARILIGFLAFMTMLLLIAIDFWTLWAAFMVGLASLLALSFLGQSHFPNMRRLALPAGLFLVAILFLFLKSPINLKIPAVVSPSVKASFSIATSTLRQHPVSLLLGSGPGSFDLDYAKHRPVEINSTIFWNTRFDRAQIHLLTILATNGILGSISWILLVLLVAGLGLGRIMRGRDESEWKWNYALLSGWLALLVVQLLSPINMSLTILFWGLSGLLVAEAVGSARRMEFSEAPRLALAVTSGLAMLSVGGVLTVFALVSRHSAEMAFAKAARMDAAGATPLELVDQMSKAVDRDGSNAVFERNLATAYLAQAGVVVREGVADKEFSEEEKQALATVADLSIKAAARAAALGENDAANWSINGLIYRELMPFIQNAQNFAASMYMKALELEPNNVSYQTALARVYLAVADRAQEIQDLPDVDAEVKATAATNEIENLRIAVENFEIATRLKPDYAPAHYYLAAAYERQGNLEDASARLEALTKVQPTDAGLGFQLAVIYLKMEETDKAEAELERILAVSKDYSNAMWYLAALKANAGEIESALALLERVEKLNPDNQVVKESIANLRAGNTPPVDPAPIDTTIPSESLPGQETVPTL